MVQQNPCVTYDRIKARQLELLKQRQAETVILNHLRPIEREEIEALRGFCVPINKIRELLTP